MLFDSWSSIGRVVILAAATYAILIAALRIAGAQALAKMSAYDLVITIAMGSIVATIPLSTGATLADGVAVIVTYLGLQAVLRTIMKHSSRARRVAKTTPSLVLWDGILCADQMHEVNVTDDEVRAAVRKSGLGSLQQVQAVVLENDGQWSVIERRDSASGDRSALDGIDLPDRRCG